jgi:dienelactone hydrolase
MFLVAAWAEEDKPLSPEQAIKKVNDRVLVEMTVKASKNRLEKRGEIYLDSEPDFRDPKNLGVVITKTGAAAFAKAGVDEPAGHFHGKTIRVTGTMIIKEKRQRIEVDDPKQIKVVQAKTGIHTERVEYKHGDTVLEGFLAYDEGTADKRPGVLIVHEWTGMNPYVEKRAEQLAKMGYVAFALDMYGKGVRAKDAKEAASLAGKYKGDRKLMRTRAQAGLDVLTQQSRTDPKRVAAIGYCFGGTTVLELARAGTEINGVVSFHGDLATPSPEDAKNIKAKVLVCHGADDPFVPPDVVSKFEDEMRKGGVDWQLIAYGNAVHSFTNPGAGADKSRGAAYDAEADRRSWAAMEQFFGEIFGKK